VWAAVGGRVRVFGPMPDALLALVASLAAAEASWWLVERPALRVKDRLHARPAPRPVPVGGVREPSARVTTPA